MEPLPEYEYSHLTGRRSIRLLAVHPAGGYESPLVVTLEQHHRRRHKGNFVQARIETALEILTILDTARLQEKTPPYEAISYAWGTDTSSEHVTNISVNGRMSAIRVRRNVSNMLQALRWENGLRRVWIDALCINQNDLEEKEQQVRRMGDIYADADRVLIWLGGGHRTFGTDGPGFTEFLNPDAIDHNAAKARDQRLLGLIHRA